MIVFDKTLPLEYVSNQKPHFRAGEKKGQECAWRKQPRRTAQSGLLSRRARSKQGM